MTRRQRDLLIGWGGDFVGCTIFWAFVITGIGMAVTR